MDALCNQCVSSFSFVKNTLEAFILKIENCHLIGTRKKDVSLKAQAEAG